MFRTTTGKMVCKKKKKRKKTKKKKEKSQQGGQKTDKRQSGVNKVGGRGVRDENATTEGKHCRLGGKQGSGEKPIGSYQQNS